MPKSPLTPFRQSKRSIQEVTPCPAYIASAIVTARFKTYDFVQYVPKSMQNCMQNDPKKYEWNEKNT